EVHLQVQRHDDPYAGGAQEVHRDDEDAVAERLIGEDRGVHHGAVAAALVVPLPHPPHPRTSSPAGKDSHTSTLTPRSRNGSMIPRIATHSRIVPTGSRSGRALPRARSSGMYLNAPMIAITPIGAFIRNIQ